MKNWISRPDGHMELRDGYTVLDMAPVESGVPIHSCFPYQTLLGAVLGATVTQTVVANSLTPGNYYVLIVKETASGALTEMSVEYGPIVVDATHGFTVSNLPQDLDAAAWRIYFGIGPGNENQYVRQTYLTVQADNWTIAVTNLLVPSLIASGVVTQAAPLTLNTTGAQLLIAVMGCGASQPDLPTIADNESNGWAYLPGYGNGGTGFVKIAYCYAPTVGAGHQFTIADPYAAIVYAFGNTGAGIFDLQNGDIANTGTWQAGAIVPSVNDIVIAASEGNTNLSGSASITIDSGFSVPLRIDHGVGGGNGVTAVASYLIAASGASLNPTWSITVYGGIGGGTVLAGFKTANVFLGAPPFPNGTECLLFWQGTTPKLLNLTTLGVTSPGIRGAAIASSKRWSYALGKLGFIYLHNGTDYKFFDGIVFRDIGLPELTAAQVLGTSVTPGLSGITTIQAEAVLNSLTGTDGGWNIAPYDRLVYMGFFDLDTNELMTGPTPIATIPAGEGALSAFPHLAITGLPVSPSANVVKIFGVTLPGATDAIPVLGGAIGFNVTEPSIVPGSLASYGWNWGLGSGGFNIAYPARAADFSLPTPPSLSWIGAASGTMKMNTIGPSGAITGTVDTGKGPGPWQAAITFNMNFPIAGQYTFSLIHDDGMMVAFDPTKATLVEGVVVQNKTEPINAGVLAAKTGYPLMAGTNNAGATVDTLVINVAVAGVITGEINWFNWKDQSRMALQCNGQDIPPTPAPGPSTGAEGGGPIGDGLAPPLFGPVLATTAPYNYQVQMEATAHGLATGDIICLLVQQISDTVPPFASAGPFAVTVIDANNFTFNTALNQASLYVGFDGYVQPLYWVASAVTTATILTPAYSVIPLENMWPDLSGGEGFIQQGIPGSSVGGTQPGFQFYASVYNPVGGQHIGNRIAIGNRLFSTAACNAVIDDLPDLSLVDSEWVLLIGRTGDGGEVPYAVMDSGGNWITVPNGTTTITITESQIDGNAELPFENDIPPPFISFWREGDRMCGAILNEPFCYRSGSELDATTGIFMGDPAQAWPPRLVETFPTAASIIAGFGYMQESWVYTKNDCGQLSELSGETAWNGPYNVGIAGPHSFDQGWNGLPYWVSHDKQLCTMLPSGNGPVPISGEYEAALLAQIGDAYIQDTEVTYFRETERQIEILRIKCRDASGNPFTVIHDFNLRDQTTYTSVARSPYGQAYQENFLGPLAAEYTQFFLRDALGHGRVWVGASDGNLYQLYLGGDDAGTAFTADAVALTYIGSENSALKLIDWYGDGTVQFFIAANLNSPFDPTQWTDLTDQVRPVPGEEQDSHYMADVQNPEMTHVYLWIRLLSHAADAPDPTHPTANNVPPHIPVETYGRILMVTPVMGDSRGR